MVRSAVHCAHDPNVRRVAHCDLRALAHRRCCRHFGAGRARPESRCTGAIRVANNGWPALFDAATRSALRLDALPTDFRRKHEDAIAIGHCNQLPAGAVPALARAQMARDIVMAQSIRPYADRGVVLLAGNGHVRRDVGVSFWLPAGAARGAISIGVLERDDSSVPESATDFDAYVITDRAERPDPCKELAKHLRPVTVP